MTRHRETDRLKEIGQKYLIESFKIINRLEQKTNPCTRLRDIEKLVYQ